MYVSSKDALNIVPLLPDIYDEPFADSSQIPTYLVSKIANQKLRYAFLVMEVMNYLVVIIGI